MCWNANLSVWSCDKPVTVGKWGKWPKTKCYFMRCWDLEVSFSPSSFFFPRSMHYSGNCPKYCLPLVVWTQTQAKTEFFIKGLYFPTWAVLGFTSSLIQNRTTEKELPALEKKRSVRELGQATPELNLADHFISQERKRQGTLDMNR